MHPTRALAALTLFLGCTAAKDTPKVGGIANGRKYEVPSYRVKEIVEQARARRAHRERLLEEDVLINVEKAEVVDVYEEADRYAREMKDELNTWVNNQKDENR